MHRPTVKVRGVVIGEGIPKIAVPVMKETEEQILKEAQAACRAGAEILEFRADAFANVKDRQALTELLTQLRKTAGERPVLFTFRTVKEGGVQDASEDEYTKILHTAAGSGAVDLLDIEAFHGPAEERLKTAHGYGVPVILSFHDFQKTPAKEELYRDLCRMKEMGADLAKIACMPAGDGDAAAVLAVSAYAKEHLGIPFIAICMGRSGEDTRLAGELYGSAVTFGCLSGSGSAPGQWNVAELEAELLRIHNLRYSRTFLFLIGFMGTGKTTVAAELSARTGLPVLEMDQTIEKEEGKSIPAIFEEDGEEVFRDLETALIAGLYRREGGAVVSCGGGAVLRPENGSLMRSLGKTVLLTAEPETILDRLSGESEGRPNIRNRMNVEGIRDLCEKRAPFYRNAADVVIPTDGRTPSQIAAGILGKVTAAEHQG